MPEEKSEKTVEEIQREALKKLAVPFPETAISMLPKPTAAQTDAVKRDYKAGIRCKICGAWHHPDVIHLPYVGHAALTARLLEVDPLWDWRPMATNDATGLPIYDKEGGLWIYLTICGVTRRGYGHAGGKAGGDAIKEIIGDALRNAAMRFGCALDLWFKGEMPTSTLPESIPESTNDELPDAGVNPYISPEQVTILRNLLKGKGKTEEAFCKHFKHGATLEEIPVGLFSQAETVIKQAKKK